MSARTGGDLKPGELTCEQLAEIITDYFDGAPGMGDRARFEAHLAGCENCTTYVAQLRLTVEVTGRVEAESIAPGARVELLEAFRGWPRRGR